MHQILRAATVSCVAIVLATSVSAQQHWSVTGQEVPELAAVDQMMQDIMQSSDIRGGSVAIAKDGRLVYARGFTWDQPGVEAVQPTTLFASAASANRSPRSPFTSSSNEACSATARG